MKSVGIDYQRQVKIFKAETAVSKTGTIAMKKLALLLLLMISPGLVGADVVVSHQRVGAGLRSPMSDALPLYEPTGDHPTTVLDEKNRGDERRSLPDGPTHELEMKRLKLILLLMMSLDQYRSPSH
jgi:hypothetical protein